MKKIRLGKTDLYVTKNGFGALPVQRVGMEEACKILKKAYDGGINYFDTARFYTDSEEKIGVALSDVRENIIISSKTMAKTPEDFRKDLQTSLSLLKTDYIDIYQFHNPSFCPKPGDGSGLYEEMLKAKEEGKIRQIGTLRNAPVPVFLSCERKRRSARPSLRRIRCRFYLHESACRRPDYEI